MSSLAGNVRDLRISTWNIHGHIHKLSNNRENKFQDNEFSKLLSNYHIVGLSETHAGPEDDIDLPGYVCFRKCRTKQGKAGKYSGGVAVYVTQSIAHLVSQQNTSNPDAIWLKLDKTHWGTDHDLYLATVYIPPKLKFLK